MKCKHFNHEIVHLMLFILYHQSFCSFVSPANQSGTMGSHCPASVCPCYCLSVCVSDSHTFSVVAHSYVSQATHAFLGMLPLFVIIIKNIITNTKFCMLILRYAMYQ